MGRRKRKALGIFGISISISLIAFIAAYIFFKALSIKYEDFFVMNVNMILLVSGIIFAVLVVMGYVSLKSMAKRTRNVF